MVCGYLVRRERLTAFGDANNIPYEKNCHVFLRPLVVRFVEKKYPRVAPPITVRYPRLQSSFLSPRYLMFVTRTRDAPDNYEFTESIIDQGTLQRYKSLDPDMENLLADAKFVTVPNPSSDMRLPGEELRPEDKVCSSSDSRIMKDWALIISDQGSRVRPREL